MRMSLTWYPQVPYDTSSGTDRYRIRQWYSRGDGKGVVFILDSKDEAEAHAVMDALPLSAENLMDHQFIPIGPLMPLGALLGGAPQTPANG